MKSLDVKKTLPWILFLIFFAVLNETVFNVATPAIAAQYGLSPTGVSWMMTTFIVFFGVGSVVYGRLSDLFSLKYLIIFGIGFYAFGSLVGLVFSGSYPAVLVARAVQGAGGSAIPALVMVIVARYFAPEVRGRLFGAIGSVVAVALGLGPVLGGLITGTFHWTWLFLVPLATLGALPFLGRILPDEPRKPGRVDVPGAFLLTMGLGSLILWLTYPEWYWVTAGVVLMAVFTVRGYLVKDPFIRPDLLVNGPFRRGVVTSFFLFGVLIGIFFVLPLILHKVHGLEPSSIGLVLFPGAISGVIFGPVGGRLADKRGNRFVLTLGLGLTTASLAGVSFFLGGATWVVSGFLLFTYIGFSFLQTSLINSVSQTLPEHETGVGMGLFNLVGIVAGAVGTALAAQALDSGLLDYREIFWAFTLAAGAAGVWYAVTLGPYTAGNVSRKPNPPPTGL